MGRFVYSLDRLLEIRKLEQRKIESKAGPTVAKINSCVEGIKKSKDIAERTYQHLENMQMSSQKMVQYLSYTRDVSIKKVREQQDHLQQYEKQYEEEYANLVRQARVRSKSLEILREKKLLEHKKFLRRKEEKEIEDHIFSRRQEIRL